MKKIKIIENNRVFLQKIEIYDCISASKAQIYFLKKYGIKFAGYEKKLK